MERLTNRLPDGTAYVVSETGTEGVGYFTTQRRLPELIARLAAYEDTGLTPEELKALKDLTVLRIEKTLTDDELEELRRELEQHPGTLRAIMAADTCVCCGEIIPEGRQVCPACEKEAGA